MIKRQTIFNFIYYITGAQKKQLPRRIFLQKSPCFSTSFDALHDNKAEAGKIFLHRPGCYAFLFVHMLARCILFWL